MGGVAVSRTRNGLLIREPRSPYRPTPKKPLVRAPGIEPGGDVYKTSWLYQSHARWSPSGTGGGIRTPTEPLLGRRPPSVGLHRRRTGPGDRTLQRPVCDTGAFASSLVPLAVISGLSGGTRTPSPRLPEPVLYQIEPH